MRKRNLGLASLLALSSGCLAPSIKTEFMVDEKARKIAVINVENARFTRLLDMKSGRSFLVDGKNQRGYSIELFEPENSEYAIMCDGVMMGSIQKSLKYHQKSEVRRTRLTYNSEKQ